VGDIVGVKVTLLGRGLAVAEDQGVARRRQGDCTVWMFSDEYADRHRLSVMARRCAAPRSSVSQKGVERHYWIGRGLP